ncbi:MAG TPA: twin-arginine translocation signal domain-containing protein, partial [Candidatus Hydrogenedentes bacterium]|nr:twin-arginine translocation signal domain-containing protein [Candidatus Hydrogenedentota bacterium]
MFTNRREFLKTTAALGGAAMLPYSLAMGADAPLMAIARWKGDENAPMMEVAEKLTVEAIRAIGGLEPFIKKGGTVWVKPNIGWDR